MGDKEIDFEGLTDEVAFRRLIAWQLRDLTREIEMHRSVLTGVNLSGGLLIRVNDMEKSLHSLVWWGRTIGAGIMIKVGYDVFTVIQEIIHRTAK